MQAPPVLVAAAWWTLKAWWVVVVLRESHRRRYAAAYLSAAVCVATAYGLDWLAFEPFVVALLGCGASLERQRPDVRRALLSAAVTPSDPLIEGLKHGELLAAVCARPCAICKARPGVRCDASLHG